MRDYLILSSYHQYDSHIRFVYFLGANLSIRLHYTPLSLFLLSVRPSVHHSTCFLVSFRILDPCLHPSIHTHLHAFIHT